MSTELKERLADLGRAMQRDSAPIAAAEVLRSTNDVAAGWTDAEAATVLAFPPPARRTSRVARIALVAGTAAAFSALIWAGFHRDSQQAPADVPDTTVPAAQLQPSAHPESIDNYPVLAGSGTPRVTGTWSATTEDQGWGGFLGVPPATEGGMPSDVIEVHQFPVGWTYPSADLLQPGRRPDVREVPAAGGFGTVLVWDVGTHPLTMVGDDPDLMYEVLDHIAPNESDLSRGGPLIEGLLPAGLVEIDAPRHLVPAWYPGLVDPDNDGPVSIFVQTDSPLAQLHAGDTSIRAVAIGAYRGFLGHRADGHIDLAFAIATDESVFMSTTTMSEAELLALAERVTFTDEATWRATYGVTDGGDLTDLTTPPAASADGTVVIGTAPPVTG